MDLVELHAHSHFSFLDGLASPEELAWRAKNLGYTAIALTDHGGLFGVPRFLRAAESADIKAVIGCELYVSPTTRQDRSADLRPVGHHLTLLCETIEGYRNLSTLSSLGYSEGFFHRPRVDRELLSRHAGGLILLTGCFHSAMSEMILKGNREGAEEWLGFYVETFGRDRVFVEIQNHGLDSDEKLIEELTRLAKSFKLSRVATNDVHYIGTENAEAHLCAMDTRSRKLPSDPRRVRFSKPTYNLLSGDEWAAAFKKMDDARECAAEIAGRCRLKPSDLQLKSSVFDESDVTEKLEEAVAQESQRKWGGLKKEMKEQVAEELKRIKSAGLVAYMLMIYRLVSEARRQGILVGPGRGSSAGSLVAYILGITEVDPLAYRLSFDRFLSPARKTLPDIDIDVDQRARESMIDILRGLNPGCGTFRAGTYPTLGLKTAIREIARGKGIAYREVDQKVRSIPAGASKMDADERPPWSDIAPIVHSVATLPRMTIGHPTAVIVVPQSHADLLPSYTSTEGASWLQFDGEDLDWMGIPKLDILPLKTLAILSETKRWLKISGAANQTMDFSALPLDDSAAYKLISDGWTTGLFQLESSGMRDLLRELAPNSIETLAAALALYRPGPLESDVPKNYVDRKNGRAAADPPHPMFESIVRETFGLVLYQEQVMAMAVAAGLTAAQADEFRLAMSKKNPDAMKKGCEIFSRALCERGLAEREAASIVNQVSHNASFAYNKSHAVSYALLCYQSAYLKAHHPAAFLASAVNLSSDNRASVSDLFSEIRRMGIVIRPMDVNQSPAESVPTPDGTAIHLGLRLIRHVPDKVIDEVLKARPFSDLPDLLIKVPSVGQQQSLEMLCKAGALDRLGQSRAEILASLPEWKTRIQQASGSGYQSGLFEESDAPEQGDAAAPSGVDTEDPVDIARKNLYMEHEALGFFATASPMDEYTSIVSEFCTSDLAAALARAAASTPSDPSSRQKSNLVTLAGLLTSIRIHQDKNARDMAFAVIEDGSGSLEIVLFHDAYEAAKTFLRVGHAILVRGRLEKRGASATLIPDRVTGMDQPERFYESVLLKLDEGVGMDMLKRLKQTLREYPGDRPVYVEMSEGGSTYDFRVGWSCRPTGGLRRKLETMLGSYSVFFLKTKELSLPA